jgi:hypothetical protein
LTFSLSAFGSGFGEAQAANNTSSMYFIPLRY